MERFKRTPPAEFGGGRGDRASKKGFRPDPAGEMEAIRQGRYSLTQEEAAEIRRQAELKGLDPEAAVTAATEKTRAATGRLRQKQAEEAIRGLEEHLREEE